MGGSVFEHRLLFQSEATNHKNQYKHYGGLANNFEFKFQPFFFSGCTIIGFDLGGCRMRPLYCLGVPGIKNNSWVGVA